MTRFTTATHTLIVPRGALLTEPGGRQTIWHQERAQTTEDWRQAGAHGSWAGRFLVILDGRTYYVDASEVEGIAPVD
jgi:hypothetical protein